MAIFSSDELNAYKNSLYSPKSQQTTAKPVQKKGNLLTNLLPAIGGGLGAVAGIPLDIFGGAASIAGGAAGSSLGEALKEHLLGQNLSAKQIGIQGLEGGALTAFQPIKAVKGASSAAKGFVSGGKTAEQVAEQTAAKAPTSMATRLQKAGQGFKNDATGITTGSTLPGSSAPLRPSQADKLNQYIESVPGAKNSAHTQARAVEADVNSTGKQIGDLVKQHDRTVSAPEIQIVKDTAQQAASKSLNVNMKDPLIVGTQKRLATLGKNGTLSQTKDLRDTLDDQLKSFYTSEGRNTTTTKDVEKVLKGYRDGLDKVLTNGVPGFREANSRYATGLKALNGLDKNSNPSGFRILGVQTKMGGEGLQATKNAIGRGLDKGAQALNGGVAPAIEDGATKVATATTSALPPTTLGSTLKGAATLPLRAGAAPLAYPGRSIAQVGKQGLGRALGDVLTKSQSQAQDSQTAQQPADLSSALMQAGDGSATDTSQQSQSPYSIENLQSDLQRDPTNSSKYIDYYNSLDKIYNPTPKTPTSQFSKPSTQQYSLASSALDSIQKVADMIQQSPNVVNKDSETLGQGLPLVGGLISHAAGTSDYHTQIGNIAQAILHLQTGAAFSDSEKRAVQSNLPREGDSAQTIQNKLNTLAGFLTPFLGTQTQSSGNDLTSALQQAGYSQ